MPTVHSHNADIYYEVHGAGPVLALLHGAGGNRVCWWQQVPFFARHYTVITMDHRTFGRSTCRHEDFDPAFFVDDLSAILDAENIDSAHLVCQSMGGWMGLPFTVKHPERVNSLTLACTPGGFHNAVVAAAAESFQAQMRSGEIQGLPALGKQLPDERPDLAFLYAQIGELNTGVDMGVVGRKLFGEGVRITVDDLKNYQTPTLLMTGEYDVIFPPHMMHDVASHIPGAQCKEVAHVGHSIYFENADVFNQTLLDFLQRL